MLTLLNDIRYAARGLMKSPGVSLIAVVALALGIGLTTIMFSIVYGALYRGLPFEGGERIMALGRANPETGANQLGVPIHDFHDWQAQQRSFEDIGAYFSGTVNVRSGESPERYSGGFISANTLGILGVNPVLGRGFLPEDERPDAPMALLLGFRAWRDHYGSDPNVVGTSVTVNGEPGTVVGVMAEGFLFPLQQEVWVPLRLDPVALPRGQGQSLSVLGKLRPGVGAEQALTEFNGIAGILAAEYPEANAGVVATIQPFTEAFIGPEVSRTLLAMLATVGLVLLIACANVANLLLARAAVRTRDVAIRVAIGASRTRVVLQMMGESLVLAAGGAALGILLAWVGIGMFSRVVEPTNPPFWLVFRLDGPILAFVVGVSVLAAVLSGAIPAFRASSTNLSGVLNDESRGSSGLHMGRLSRVLVVAEVAMSMAILVASGLMIRSFVQVGRMDLPFPTEDVFTARIGVFEASFPDVGARAAFWDDVDQRVATIPGVRASGLATQLPGLGAGTRRIVLDGESYTRDEDLPFTRVVAVTPGFFEVFEAPALQGRALNDLDQAEAPLVAVVNQSFVREHFPDGQVLGRRIRFGALSADAQWREIVGVVADLSIEGVGSTGGDASPAGLYLPLYQDDARFASVTARTTGVPALTLTQSVREQVAAADPDTPIYFVDTLRTRITDNLWFYSVFGGLFAAFGAAALFMASVGLYGVMSFVVSRRTLEMGIRMALGADARKVGRMVVREGMTQVVIGLVLGTGLAVLVARGIQMFLLDAAPWDPATYALVFLILTLTGFAASGVPALRATRVDPSAALRSE